MFHPVPGCALALLIVVSSTDAPAQPAIASASPPPAQLRPGPWHSALADYQRFSDEKIAPWKASNDTVGSIGGWRAYAKEASEVPVSPAPAGGSAADAPDPHAGHGKK